ncbi:MAG TPA: Plug domain-containing protein, partial [Kofleriaceae bacterium]|nr:Plug domain-containing protein [Kofleriaceae bacterium]
MLCPKWLSAQPAPAPPAPEPPAPEPLAPDPPAPLSDADLEAQSEAAAQAAAAKGETIVITDKLSAAQRGHEAAPSVGAQDVHVEAGKLATEIPHQNATDLLGWAPGFLLTNEGGAGHAEQIFLRGFDAREGQDIEMRVNGDVVNQAGNLHGNGYADLHFVIPELVQSLRVI